MDEARVLFHGDVQGVGFRHTASRMAHVLGVHGYVCNVPNGSVELLVQGEHPVLGQLIHELKLDFKCSADVSWQQPAVVYDGFNITD
jgi:acylphosphatase